MLDMVPCVEPSMKLTNQQLISSTKFDLITRIWGGAIHPKLIYDLDMVQKLKN